MAVSRTWACLGCFLVIISSQWMSSLSEHETQQESTNTPSADESKPVWGPWTRNGPQPLPLRKPCPDKTGGSSRGGVGVVGGGGRGHGIGGGGGRRGRECICNCKCDCQNSQCNGGSGRGGGGGGAGYRNGRMGGAGGGGGGGHGGYSGLTICMPLPPGMELEMPKYHFSVPSLGESGEPNAHTEGMNASATKSKHQ